MPLDEINIAESPQQLLELEAQQTSRINYHRVKALYLLRTGEASTLEDTAAILGYGVVTIGRWIKKYQQNGLEGLLPASKPKRGNDVPEWALERLRQELQNAQFLPGIEAIHAWLLTIGVKVCRSKAAEVRSWMNVYLESLKLPSNNEPLQETANCGSIQLLIDRDIYIRYEQWRKEHSFPNDTDALNRLMSELLGLEVSQKLDNPSCDIETDDSLQAPTIDLKVSTLLNQSDLAKRLSVNNSVLTKNRNKRNFPGWTKQKDPDRISWQWVPNLRKYQSFPTN